MLFFFCFAFLFELAISPEQLPVWDGSFPLLSFLVLQELPVAPTYLTAKHRRWAGRGSLVFFAPAGSCWFDRPG